MTAPQHNAKAIANQTTLQSEKACAAARHAVGTEKPGHTTDKAKNVATGSYSQKIQRCWFITLGLVGGFGFVASQMGLAIAETDFLINDYAANASNSYAGNVHTVSTNAADFGQAPLQQASFEPVPAVNAPLPTPETFISVPPSAEATAAVYQPPAVVAPEPVAAAPVAAPTPPAAVAPKPVAAAPASTIPTSIEFEITPAAVPTVTPTRPPSFTTAQKPVAHKTGARSPLAGLVEASAVAAPLSAYAINATAPSGSERALLMANQVSAPVDAEAAPATVPDILPEPIQAAPPIVETAPPAIEPIAEEVVPVQPTEIIPASLPESINLPEEYNSVFVDPTDYSVGATETTQAPEVVISEQSTGCEFTVGQNQAVPNGACGTGLPSAPAPVAEAGYAEAPVAASQPAPQYEEAAPVASAPAVNVGPVSFSASGIRLSTSAAGRDYINRSVRPLVSLQAAQNFIFPLSIPSPITSLFGFRLHPITGDQRFHAGTDIGAPQGTPVLAAQDGVVASASNAGGYGLMVVLQHALEETQLESRYAHLAEIFVEAGREVKKGDVIGLVGSTGNSTGPHLHFEMRQMTADGWVLVNADGLVQSSLANLVKALNSPMQALSFDMSDFNLSNLRANGSIRAVPANSADSNSPLPGQNGIPFRPAQPNAS